MLLCKSPLCGVHGGFPETLEVEQERGGHLLAGPMLRPWEPRGRCSPCLHVIYRPRQKGENGKRGGKGWRPSGWLSSFPFPRLPAWVLAGNSLCGANPVPSLPLLRPFPLHSALLLCPLSLKTSRRRCHPLPVSGQPLQRCLSVGALRNCLTL